MAIAHFVCVARTSLGTTALLLWKDAQVTVVVLEPAKHRELTVAGIIALNKWPFDHQVSGDDPVAGELIVRIHFRAQ